MGKFHQAACATSGMLLCLSSTAVAAETKPTALVQPITISTTTIDVTVPAGFCLASTPQEKAVNQFMADSDPDNYTALIALECGKSSAYTDKAEYFMIKAPKPMLNAKAPRANVIAEISKVFETNTVDVNKEVAKASTHLSDELNRRGAEADMGVTGNFGYRGKDDTCVYLSGIANLNAMVNQKAIAYQVAAVTCISAVDQKVLAVNWYSYDLSPASQAAIKAKAKKLIATMSGNRPQ